MLGSFVGPSVLRPASPASTQQGIAAKNSDERLSFSPHIWRTLEALNLFRQLREHN
jgi:hypothetical protein